MINLIFITCLKLAVDSCEERSKVYTEDIGIMGCMVTAQAELAAWVGAHPQFKVVRWSCGWVDSDLNA